jgi:hypothetical protein
MERLHFWLGHCQGVGTCIVNCDEGGLEHSSLFQSSLYERGGMYYLTA